MNKEVVMNNSNLFKPVGPADPAPRDEGRGVAGATGLAPRYEARGVAGATGPAGPAPIR